MMGHALIAGNFDPPTLGHLNLIERTERLFDRLTVAVARDASRDRSLFSAEERVGLLKILCSVPIVDYSGLTVELARSCEATLLVRGVRSLADLDHELSLAAANRKLTGIDTLLLPADPALCHVSGKLVREVGRCGHSLSEFVPASIERQVRERLS